MMEEVQHHPVVLSHVLRICADGGERREALQRWNKDLESIEDLLRGYLNAKRALAPRLYFVSDEELLKMLPPGRERDHGAVERQLTHCFEGVGQVAFVDHGRNWEIEAVVSPEGERLSLGRLKVRPHPEEMVEAAQVRLAIELRKALHGALEDPPLENDWVSWVLDLRQPMQASQLATRVMFCSSVEDALVGHVAAECEKLRKRRLTLHLEPLAAAMRDSSATHLVSLQRCRASALIHWEAARIMYIPQFTLRLRLQTRNFAILHISHQHSIVQQCGGQRPRPTRRDGRRERVARPRPLRVAALCVYISIYIHIRCIYIYIYIHVCMYVCTYVCM